MAEKNVGLAQPVRWMDGPDPIQSEWLGGWGRRQKDDGKGKIGSLTLSPGSAVASRNA